MGAFRFRPLRSCVLLAGLCACGGGPKGPGIGGTALDIQKGASGSHAVKAPPSECVIDAEPGKDETFSYAGHLWIDGSQVAHTKELGTVERVKLTLVEKEPLAFVDYTTDKFVFHAQMAVGGPTYYGRTPIVREGWLLYDELSIRTVTSVQGSQFAPETVLVNWVVPERPNFVDEDSFRVPCASATPFFVPGIETRRLEAPIVEGVKAQGGRITATKPVSLQDDTGKTVATLNFPADKTAPERLVWVTGKKSGRTRIVFSTGKALRAQGWIPSMHVQSANNEVLGSGGHGAGHGSRKVQYTYLKCMQDAPIWVRTAEGTKSLGLLRAEHPVRGVFVAGTGDFRMDLGSDAEWSPTQTREAQKGAPVDPYVPHDSQTGVCGEVAAPSGR